MSDVTSRRERKKQRTRALIRETAWELFAADGYETTTIKAIAEAADVAPRTVTLHFPVKDDLLFAAEDDAFDADRLAERLAQRPAGEPALETLRQWMVDTLDKVSRDQAERAGRYWQARALRARLIADNERLRGRARASYASAEHVLAAAVAEDLHVEPDSLAARLTAVSAVAGLRELYETSEARALEPEPVATDLVPLVDRVITYATAGLAALTAPAGLPH
jgi:AcrR family transcriptional regulator